MKKSFVKGLTDQKRVVTLVVYSPDGSYLTAADAQSIDSLFFVSDFRAVAGRTMKWALLCAIYACGGFATYASFQDNTLLTGIFIGLGAICAGIVKTDWDNKNA